MFGHRYFGAPYYGPRYYGPGVTAPVPVVVSGGGGGGALDMGEDFIYERPKKIKHAMLEAMAERGYITRHKDEPIAALKHIEAYDETDDLESILWLDD